MLKTDIDSYADVEFELHWKSHYGTHTERLFAEKVKLGWDVLPIDLRDKLMNRSVGDSVETTLNSGEMIPNPDPVKLFPVKSSQFENKLLPDIIINSRRGRFYPKGILRDVPNVFRTNQEPFRCAEVNNSHILVDFNHALSGIDLNVKATVRDIKRKASTSVMGVMINDWMEILTTGPGMQSRWNRQPTDFFSDNAFARLVESDDSNFYKKPRFVDHLDETAMENVSALYGKILHTGSNVLDLMSSWKSHISPDLKLGRFAGLGMNKEELERNERLTDTIVQDLNKNHILPFVDKSFDAVICTASVEYLTNPVAVFKEVGRILKSGGCFILTFSNRWFPPKAISMWQHMYEFERMGLVSEYFLLSDVFEGICTQSVRGLPRPEGDKYFGELFVSDPIYGIWAFKR